MDYLRYILVPIGILVLVIVFSAALKLYIKLTMKWCTSKVCLVGKTTIVTGGNAGIGYETALEFAKRGARVILACRDEARGTEARDKIIKETLNRNVVLKLVDFASLKSVRNFAKNILETEERLDILVNNAGVVAAEGEYSEDGLPLVMQINYFGPVLLTILLIDLLKKSAPSRIVNVSSGAAAHSKLVIDNLNTFPGSYYSYSNSKVGNVLFTIYFAKILEKYNVSVFSLHPGVVSTEILRPVRGAIKHLANCLRIFFKTSEEGAQTTLYTSIEQGIEIYSGSHFDDCKKIKTYKTAADPDLPEKLWNKTVELLKCEEDVKKL